MHLPVLFFQDWEDDPPTLAPGRVGSAPCALGLFMDSAGLRACVDRYVPVRPKDWEPGIRQIGNFEGCKSGTGTGKSWKDDRSEGGCRFIAAGAELAAAVAQDH